MQSLRLDEDIMGESETDDDPFSARLMSFEVSQ